MCLAKGLAQAKASGGKDSGNGRPGHLSAERESKQDGMKGETSGSWECREFCFYPKIGKVTGGSDAI